MRIQLLVLASMMLGCGASTVTPPPRSAPAIVGVAPVPPLAPAPAPAPVPPPTPETDTTTPEGNAAALRARLVKDTGTDWTVYVDKRNQEIRHLSPLSPVMFGTGSAEDRARAFFATYAAELHASTEDLRLVRADTGPSGSTGYVRFEHYVKGTELPIFDAVSSASFDKTGALYMTQPGFRAGLDKIPTRAAITSAEAEKRVLTEWHRRCPARGKAPVTSLALGIRGAPTLPPLLVWRAQLQFAYDSNACQMEELLVDATTGAIADR